METLWLVVGWANYLLTWVWVIWFGVGIAVGAVLLVFDEWRLHRTRPKPEEIHAHADWLIHRHGQNAFLVNGDAMIEARSAKKFDRYRFLREVSGELVRRLFEQSHSDDPPSSGTQMYRERPENARSLMRVDPVLNSPITQKPPRGGLA